ncbi:MAG TPA: hypothetical protein ENJ68_02775 [Devosia sp.]|nr:hypothetical protein [Devosia sp.]
MKIDIENGQRIEIRQGFGGVKQGRLCRSDFVSTPSSGPKAAERTGILPGLLVSGTWTTGQMQRDTVISFRSFRPSRYPANGIGVAT